MEESVTAWQGAGSGFLAGGQRTCSEAPARFGEPHFHEEPHELREICPYGSSL